MPDQSTPTIGANRAAATPKAISPPIFILGVHRSGTSLLTRMVEALGVFVGNDLQGDHESLSVIAINNAYLNATQSSWDAPRYPGPAELADNLVKRLLLGNQQAFFRSFGRPLGIWAMKDPRFVITLPLWRAVFPSSPVLVIRRSPLEIAASLHRRHCELQASGVFPEDGDFFKGRVKFTQNCATQEGALAVARQQIAHLDNLIEQDLCRRRLELSYSALCRDPAFEVWNLSRFLGLKPTEEQVARAIALPRNGQRGVAENQAAAARLFDFRDSP